MIDQNVGSYKFLLGIMLDKQLERKPKIHSVPLYLHALLCALVQSLFNSTQKESLSSQ